MADASRSSNQAALHTDVKGPDEDWTGLSDAQKRRKLQNRLNQRASRRRKTVQQAAKDDDVSLVRKWIVYTDTGIKADDTDTHLEDGDSRSSDGSISDVVPCRQRSRTKNPRLCQLTLATHGAFFHHLNSLVLANFAKRVLDSELLLSVAQFNIVRAMASNAAHLGLTMELLREDIPSPFNTAAHVTNLPPGLQPTELQKQIPHHPWIDICPSPSIRNTMLLRMGEYDDDELCHDLFMGVEGGNATQIGLVVWGEAWDPSAYELSSEMVRKWPWFAQDCPDMIHSTNRWRIQRDEKPLTISFEPNH